MGDNPYKDLQLTIYAAGFFDGEGCVVLNTTGSEDRVYANGRLKIGNTDPRPLILLEDKWDGTIRVQNSGGEGRRRAFEWAVGGDEGVEFAKSILPHVVIKREQIELFLDFMGTRAGGGQFLTDAIRKRRVRILDYMKELKSEEFSVEDAYLREGG